MIFDIGPKSAQELVDIIMKAGTVVWNGPVGVFEFDQFGEGTKAIAMAIANTKAFTLAGGGDTIAAIQKYDIYDKVSYISTAGGAFLEFLEGKTCRWWRCSNSGRLDDGFPPALDQDRRHAGSRVRSRAHAGNWSPPGSTWCASTFSHGTADDHRSAWTRCVPRRKAGRTVGVMADLQGPKIRIGKFAVRQGPAQGRRQEFVLDAACTLGDAGRVGLDYPDLVNDVQAGDVLLLDDGRIVFDVLQVQGTRSAAATATAASCRTTRASTSRAAASRRRR
jgi:hypothetical protein